VNVISRRKLRDFYQAKPERRRHAAGFDIWFKLARKAHWRNFQDARATFGQIDVAIEDSGRTATIFDIGGNKYRVIAHVDYRRQTLKIEAVMDHREDDKRLWKKLF
jgi:mRNA interferase HigB